MYIKKRFLEEGIKKQGDILFFNVFLPLSQKKRIKDYFFPSFNSLFNILVSGMIIY